MGKFPYLRRSADAACFYVENPLGLDVRLFANESVPLERESFEQLFEFLDVARAVDDIRRRGIFGDAPASLDRVVLTPDFHKGSLVPVGTVARARHFCIPQAIGNDIEEAPYAYKSVEPVVDSVEEGHIAHKVARLWPLCTVKG